MNIEGNDVYKTTKRSENNVVQLANRRSLRHSCLPAYSIPSRAGLVCGLAGNKFQLFTLMSEY
jgi:hypothetical protein